MALKAIVAKIDEVEERYRDLYVQKGDKFEIQVEGIKTEGDLKRVNDALIKERADHKAATDKLKEAADKLVAFGELTPEKVTELQEKLATLEAAGTPELTKNFEKIVTDRVNALKDAAVKTATGKLEKTIADLTTQLTGVATENQTLKLADTHRTIDDAIRGAAVKAKVLEGATVDALIRARGVFELQDGKVVTKDGLTAEDWIEKRKEDAGHWWPVARGAGAQGSDGKGNYGSNAADNPWTREGWNITKQGQMVREDAAKATQFAERAGVKVGATAPLPAQK